LFKLFRNANVIITQRYKTYI